MFWRLSKVNSLKQCCVWHPCHVILFLGGLLQWGKLKLYNCNAKTARWGSLYYKLGLLSFHCWILDPGSWILDPLGSWILDPGSWILDPESWILVGSWILNPGSSWILDPESWILNPESRILDPLPILLPKRVVNLPPRYRLRFEWEDHIQENLRIKARYLLLLNLFR